MDPINRQPHEPTLAAFYWEDQSTLCYHLDVNGILVSRRHDNDMVNGTKLLNLTGISRTRRDTILRGIENGVVIRVGPLHLKGIWIPYHSALELANGYDIMDRVRPLFVENPSEVVSWAATAQYNRLPASSSL
ncbi:hypothetical protein O0I10_008938 [Lichtheimia ornata]|uniref:HTH APSES-type domain-containing protein n=1 Tax=Lichtheimia ornata TaxID=688661 RepID=A0AAD7XSM2_9FUNG|nr:uncharacterized protein O0I10_008938 [Lichtheimia ornata]KAJ8655444.1 hypothetical protein O0I10_008938 [Lichtheimia ornata]